jgi:hypothetical protein
MRLIDYSRTAYQASRKALVRGTAGAAGLAYRLQGHRPPPKRPGRMVPACIHVHSYYSDGRHAVRWLAWRARASNVEVLVLTDHYEDIPLDQRDTVRKNRLGVLANLDKHRYFENLYHDCIDATRETGVLVVPAIEVDLGERCDPYLGLCGWPGGWPKTHLLGIGAITPGIYDHIVRRVLGAAPEEDTTLELGDVLTPSDAAVAGRISGMPGQQVMARATGLPWIVDEGIPLAALSRANREAAKCLSLGAGQRIAAAVLDGCDLAVVGAHPWERHPTDPFHQWALLRQQGVAIHAVEAFGRGDESERDDGALAVLGLTEPRPQPSAFLDWAVTSGSDYHLGLRKPDKITWIRLPEGAPSGASGNHETFRTACWQVAMSLRRPGNPVIAGIGLPKAGETCAQWCQRIAGATLCASRPSLCGGNVRYHYEGWLTGTETQPPPDTPHIARVPGKLCMSRCR